MNFIYFWFKKASGTLGEYEDGLLNTSIILFPTKQLHVNYCHSTYFVNEES